MNKSTKRILLWIGIILLFLALYQWFPGRRTGPSFDQFVRDLDTGRISAIKVDGDAIEVQLVEGGWYTVYGEIGDSLQTRIVARASQKNGPTLRYSAGSGGSSSWLQWLPTALVIGFLYLMIRAMRRPADGGATHFGKSRAQLVDAAQQPVTFADVAGAHAAKAALGDLVSFLREPDRWTQFGARIPTGCLLVGPPGCGKTLLARAVAGEAGVPFFSISGADFVEMFVGVGAARVRDLFKQGLAHAPCVIFIDELDAVGRKRGSGVGGGHDEREQTLNQLLVSMDGFETNSGVIVIAATNRKDVLDKALIRAGRFDRIVEVPLPDQADRRAILAVHTQRTPLAEDVQLDDVAADTAGFCGADLENLVNEAALQAVRRLATDDPDRSTVVTDRDFTAALLNVRAGRRAFATLDLILIESATQLAQPAERLYARMFLTSGEVLEGELRWADSTFIGYRRPQDADDVVIPKASVIKFEAINLGGVLGSTGA